MSRHFCVWGGSMNLPSWVDVHHSFGFVRSAFSQGVAKKQNYFMSSSITLDQYSFQHPLYQFGRVIRRLSETDGLNINKMSNVLLIFGSQVSASCMEMGT